MNIVPTINSATRRVPTWVLYTLLSLPALYLTYALFTNQLGSDPIRAYEREIGQWALKLIMVDGYAVARLVQIEPDQISPRNWGDGVFICFPAFNGLSDLGSKPDICRDLERYCQTSLYYLWYGVGGVDVAFGDDVEQLVDPQVGPREVEQVAQAGLFCRNRHGDALPVADQNMAVGTDAVCVGVVWIIDASGVEAA